MQIKRMLYAAGAVATLFLCGCASDTPGDIADGKGRIVMHVGVTPDVTDAVPVTRASQASKVPDSSELNLKLTKTDGSYSQSWGSVAEFPADKQFNTGAYTLEAYYGAPDFEGFDAPYFYGVADLNVLEGAETEVSVTARLANTMVSIDYTEAFRSYFPQYSAQLHSEGGDYISFESQEQRPAYLRPGTVTLDVSITKQNGLSASLQAAEFEALPQHHYHITLDVNDGQTGQGVLQVIFDDSIVTEDVDIDISDAVLLMPGPTVTPTGFTDGQTLSVVEGERTATARATINASGGLRSVTLTTQSTELLQRGLPAEIDLMKATPAQQSLLKSFGLDVKGLYSKPDKMAVVDFAGLLANINTSGTHSFTLVAVDKLGKTHDPLTLMASMRPVNMEITSIPAIRIDRTEAKLRFSYDGTAPGDNVKLEVQNASGDWVLTEVQSVSAVSGGYEMTFTVPAAYRNYPVRLLYGSKVKATGTLRKTGVLLSAADVDVWATHAIFKVQKNEDVDYPDLRFYVSTDGSNYSLATGVTYNASEGTIKIPGLTPGTAYTVKGSDDGTEAGAYRACSITTEAAAQPQNGNMDDWSRDEGWQKAVPVVGYVNTIYKYFPWSASTDNAYWATRNALTTHKDHGYTSMWYNYYSGTYNAAGVNGTNCAEICTVGYAKNNKNTFIETSDGGLVNHRDAGYLFMGSYTYDKASDKETFSYGRPFTSRPATLTFMYKFASYNSESFKAYAVVENRAGGNVTELGRGELESGEDKSSFTLATIPIKYTNTKLKATHAYIVFISSTSAAPQVKAVKGSKGALQGYTDARYIGNVLDVDNISFTY